MATRLHRSKARLAGLALSMLAFLAACSPGAKKSGLAAPSPESVQPVTPVQASRVDPTGPYFGYALPGAEPQPFGKDFLSGQFHSAPSFSPDGKAAWWAGSFRSARIFRSTLGADGWSAPDSTPLWPSIDTYRDPFISPDGQRLYFISTDPLPGASSGGKENIWMAEHGPDGWREPEPLPAGINALTLHWTMSVAANYDLYFAAETEPGNSDLYMARWMNQGYVAAERLPEPLNSAINEYTPNIAPDAAYVLFSRFEGNSGTPRLMVSYRRNGGWSEPALVDNVPYCISPVVTPDRKYVVYLSSAASLAWRDTSFLE